MDIESIALGGGEALNYGDVQDNEPTPDDEAMHGLIAGTVDGDDEETRHTRKRPRKSENVTYEDAEDTATHQGLCCQLCRFHTNDRFGPYLTTLGFKLTPTSLRQLDIEQLQDLQAARGHIVHEQRQLVIHVGRRVRAHAGGRDNLLPHKTG